MQSSVGSLLLITSAVMISCFVIGFAANLTVEIIQNPEALAGPQLSNLKSTLYNQTYAPFNQTQPPPVSDASPTP